MRKTVLLALFLLPGCPCVPTKPCTPQQCQAVHAASGGYCGASAPYGCTLTGGCYADPTSAQQGCPNNWCSTLACSNYPQPQRASRNIVVQNNCGETLSIWITNGAGDSFCDGGARCQVLSVDAGQTGTFNVQLVNAGGFFWLPAGINLWAMPDDGDIANTTLFEIDFGAFGGTADSYDLSAIPPGSCSGHVHAPSNDLGYADHLPYKDPTNPIDNWGCLTFPDGGVNPATCGDGLGASLCPPVVSDSGYGTIKPLTAVKGTNTGCGVPNEKCANDAGCCPDICATSQDQDGTQSSVRTLIYECAHAQALLTGTGRQTGYWKSLSVVPGGDSGCPSIRCIVPDGGDFSSIGTTCQGYLWPYDDAAAAQVCGATPDYTVTFCP